MSSAEDMGPLTAAPPAAPSEPQAAEPHPEEPQPEESQPEEFAVESHEAAPPELELAEPAEPSEPAPKPVIKTNMVPQEVRVKATGTHPGVVQGEQEPFTEETTSVLVCENGGVIRLSAAVVPGQLLFLINLESNREVVAQVKLKRSYRPTSCYVELEFAEPAPRFWGREFTAAAALLPKDPKEVEFASLVLTSETTTDQPAEPHPAVRPEQLQALKRQVEVAREQPKPAQPPAVPGQIAEQAPASSRRPAPELVPAYAQVPPAPQSLAGADAPATTAKESHWNAASDEPPASSSPSASLPLDRLPVPSPLTPAEQASLPTPSIDFSKSLPKAKSKRFLRAQGNLTPGSGMRLALLSAILVVTVIGAVWYEHWIPWPPSAKKASASVSTGAVNAPVNPKPSASPTSPEAAAAHSDPGATAPRADSSSSPAPDTASTAVDSAAQPSASSEAVSKPLAKRTAAPALASKRSPAVPAVKSASDSIAASAADGTIVPPKLIKSVPAVASIEALRDFERGNVVIDAVVGTSGEITSMNVLSGPPSLRDLAVENLKQYRYEPATRNGQPVPAHVTVTIRFRFEP